MPQLSLSFLSQSSFIKSSPPSSLPRSNLPSVQTLSQSSSSQSLSATATFFIPKCQYFFLLDSPTAPPKFQTLPGSSPLHQVFSSPFKTASDHIPSTEPTKLITLPTSLSSSSETQHSSQHSTQSQSSLPLPFLSSATSPCTPTFPSCPTPTAHPSFSAPPATSCHHLVPNYSSKVLPATPGSSLYVGQYNSKNTITTCRTHVACGGLITVELLAKATTELFLVGIFNYFFYNILNLYPILCSCGEIDFNFSNVSGETIFFISVSTFIITTITSKSCPTVTDN